MNPHVLEINYKISAKVVGRGQYPDGWGTGVLEGLGGAGEVGSKVYETCKNAYNDLRAAQGKGP